MAPRVESRTERSDIPPIFRGSIAGVRVTDHFGFQF